MPSKLVDGKDINDMIDNNDYNHKKIELINTNDEPIKKLINKIGDEILSLKDILNEEIYEYLTDEDLDDCVYYIEGNKAVLKQEEMLNKLQEKLDVISDTDKLANLEDTISKYIKITENIFKFEYKIKNEYDIDLDDERFIKLKEEIRPDVF